METKQWWRPTETLYNFISQCASKVDIKRLECMDLKTSNYSHSEQGNQIYVRASPKGFLSGKYDTLSFDTHVPKLADGKARKIISQIVDTGKGYNLQFSAGKWQDNEKKKFELEITKASVLDNFFAATVLYRMEAEGNVSADDLTLYKNIALQLGAVVKPQTENANMFEISEKRGMAYAAKLVGMDRLWEPARAYELASENGFDVSLRSIGKRKIMGASFSRHYSTQLYANMRSATNILFGINTAEAEELFRLFNSVREFGGREWTVEYRMKPEPVKVEKEKEPEKPKNIIMTTEMQKDKFIDDVIKSLEPKK